jgi:hypothetical protein
MLRQVHGCIILDASVRPAVLRPSSSGKEGGARRKQTKYTFFINVCVGNCNETAHDTEHICGAATREHKEKELGAGRRSVGGGGVEGCAREKEDWRQNPGPYLEYCFAQHQPTTSTTAQTPTGSRGEDHVQP